MVVDSVTDYEVFNSGSPILRDSAKKRRANWFWKLKQWKIDARTSQWIYEYKRTHVDEEENGCRLKSLREKMIDWKTSSSYEFTIYDDETALEKAWSGSSPTSVLKSKGPGSNKSGGNFCRSNQITEEEEEEVFDDAFDNWEGFSDALGWFDNEDEDPLLETTDSEQEYPNASQRNSSTFKSLNESPLQETTNSSPEKATHDSKSLIKKEQMASEEQESGSSDDEKSECPICSEEMDATDLSFLPCQCGFRLCLFCHKKINENDGRCPGCRNKYKETSGGNSSEVSFRQRGRGTVRLSPSFRGLDRA